MPFNSDFPFSLIKELYSQGGVNKIFMLISVCWSYTIYDYVLSAWKRGHNFIQLPSPLPIFHSHFCFAAHTVCRKEKSWNSSWHTQFVERITLFYISLGLYDIKAIKNASVQLYSTRISCLNPKRNNICYKNIEKHIKQEISSFICLWIPL